MEPKFDQVDWFSFYGVQQCFSYIMALSFIGGGNRRTAQHTLSHNVLHFALIEIQTHNIKCVLVPELKCLVHARQDIESFWPQFFITFVLLLLCLYVF